MIFYKFGIQDDARWQFCRIAQPPFSIFWAIILSAKGPCPWPKLILSSEIPYCLEKLDMAMNGSDPGESINNIGVTELESGYIFCKSNGRGWTNEVPMVFFTNYVQC